MTFEQYLAQNQGWLITVSRNYMRYLKVGQSLDDLRQEASIAMWKAFNSWDGRGTLDGWTHAKAIWAMKDFVRHDQRADRESLLAEDYEEVIFDKKVEPVEYGSVLDNYHNTEIVNALTSITPLQQEYVHRRFWLDQSYIEIKEAMGSAQPATYWTQRKYGARDRLRKSLAHLEGMI